MRNLKRALSLALASVMVLGMMVVGAGAASFDDFSDKDKVVNKEAVSILNTLNVINGKDDGSFDPTGIVTRAEMAKMICVVLNGGKDPNLGTTATTTYSDTAGTWAAAYIEFCTTKGIVGGDGTGKFNPTNTVTGAEAAKMLLVAVGYNATYEKMVGAQWATSVNVLANTNGLYEGLTIDPSVGLTRDDAAQMIYNALSADMVKYTNAFVTGADGSLTSIPTVGTLAEKGETKTLLTEAFKAVKVEGVVMKNEFSSLGSTSDGSALDEGKTAIKITNADELDIDGIKDDTAAKTFSVASDVDMLGRAVTLYLKPYSSSRSNTEKGTVVGGLILSTDNKVVTDTSKDKLTDVLDDNNLELASGAVQYNNYGKAASSVDKGASQRGVERILIDNDGDGEVEIVLHNVYTFGKVTKYATKDDGSITVATAGGNLSRDKSKNVIGFEDVAKDDYVMTAEIGGKLYVEKAESISGDLTAYKANTSLTVDGTKYNVSGVIEAYASGKDVTDVDSDLLIPDSYSTLNSEATFYMDKAGNVVAVGDAEGASDNYAILWDYSSSYGNYSVKVTLSDGTTGVYDLSTKKGSLGENADNGKMDTAKDTAIFAYTLSSDDVITLKEINDDKYDVVDNAAKTFEFTKGKSAVKVDNKNVGYANDTTAFFNVTLKGSDSKPVDKVSYYTGMDSAPSIDTSKSADASGKTIRSIVVLDGNTAKAVVTYNATATANGNFLYIFGIVNNNDTGTVYKAVIDGKVVTDLQSDETDEDLPNGVYSYTENADHTYSIGDEDVNVTEGFITMKNGNSLVVDNTDLYITSSTLMAEIDGDDTDIISSVTKGDYVIVVHDKDDDEINGIFVIVDNQDDAAELTSIKVKGDSGINVRISDKDIRLNLTANTDLTKDSFDIKVSVGASYKFTNLTEDGKVEAGTKLTVTSFDGDTSTVYTFVNTNPAE